MTRLEEAMIYLNYCVKNGVDVDIDGLSDKELIEMFDHLQGQADASYDAWKERNI